jgi:predicted transcriptional regulator
MIILLNKEDLILFCIGYLKDHHKKNRYRKKEIADVLNISITTLNRYLARMRDSKLIMKNKGTEAVCGHSFTDQGMERYEKVSEIGLNLFLTPDQHSVHSMCPLRPLMRYINDPIILIKIIGQTYQGKKFDVRDLFQQENILSPNSRYYASIDEVFSIKDDSSSISPEEMLIALTNLGIKPKEARTRMDDRDRIRSTLAIAEFKRRNET